MNIADCFVIARITTRTKMIVGAAYYKTEAEATRMLKHVKKPGATYKVLFIDDFNYDPEYKDLELKTDAPEIPELPTSRRDVQEGIRFKKNSANTQKMAASITKGKSNQELALGQCVEQRKGYGKVSIRAAELIKTINEKRADCLTGDEKQAFLEQTLPISEFLDQKVRSIYTSPPETDIKECKRNWEDAKERAEKIISEAKKKAIHFGNTTCKPGSRDVLTKTVSSIVDDFHSVEGLRVKAGPRSDDVDRACPGLVECFFVVQLTRKKSGSKLEYTKKRVGGGFKTRQQAEYTAKSFGGIKENVAFVVMTADEFDGPKYETIALKRAGWD